MSDYPLTDEEAAFRIAALRAGHVQWGHAGTHHGTGTAECPRERHHHHDRFCRTPSPWELAEAGVEIPEGGWRSRG